MSKSTKTTQENKPPEWARPMLERGAKDALALYDQGIGYNTYTGPTQAPLSDPTLAGMNSLLAATGYSGSPISNASINALIPQIQMPQRQEARPTAAPQQQAAPEKFHVVKSGAGYRKVFTDGRPPERISNAAAEQAMRGKGGLW